MSFQANARAFFQLGAPTPSKPPISLTQTEVPSFRAGLLLGEEEFGPRLQRNVQGRVLHMSDANFFEGSSRDSTPGSPDRDTDSESRSEESSASEVYKLIPKPEGGVSRPGRGGYNLMTALDWSQKDYKIVKVRCRNWADNNGQLNYQHKRNMSKILYMSTSTQARVSLRRTKTL